MRYLVSGAAGFIGSHLCERLLNEGNEVVGIDNLITGFHQNLQTIEGRSGFRLIVGDAARPAVLAEAGRGFEVIMHLASLASPRDYMDHPIETLLSGSAATHSLLDLARDQGARFLLTSTSEVYGDPQVHPQTEDYWGNVNPVGPRSCYDESKRYAEAATMAYHRVHGVRTNIARIFNTYGPRMQLSDGRVVPAFLDQALRGEPITVFGDGTQTRSFCYVSDMVDGLIRLSASDEREPVNLGNPDERTMLEFAEIIKRITGSSSPIVYRPLPQDDPRRRRPDISRANEILGWDPAVPLEQGLRTTAEYFAALIPA